MNDTRFESCIKCTVCTTVCPVSGVNPRYRAKAGRAGRRAPAPEGRQAVRRGAEILHQLQALRGRLPVGRENRRHHPARPGALQHAKPSLRDAILSHTDLMGSVSTPFAPLVNAATSLAGASAAGCHA